LRRLKKKYKRPKKPWDKERIEEEKRLIEKYGLRRKREIWRAREILRRFRRRARRLAAERDKEKEKILLDKLYRMGLLDKNATLDDVLSLTVEDILERRLQTIVYKLGLAKTPKQARQFIVHGHIAFDGRRTVYPSMLVPRGMEDKISFYGKPLIDVRKGDETVKKGEKKRKGEEVRNKSKQEGCVGNSSHILDSKQHDNPYNRHNRE